MSRPCRAPSERLPRGSRKPTAIVVCAPEGRVVFRAALVTRTRLTRLHPAHQPSPVIFHRVVLLFSTGAALTELPFPSYVWACLLSAPPRPPLGKLTRVLLLFTTPWFLPHLEPHLAHGRRSAQFFGINKWMITRWEALVLTLSQPSTCPHGRERFFPVLLGVLTGCPLISARSPAWRSAE